MSQSTTRSWRQLADDEFIDRLIDDAKRIVLLGRYKGGHEDPALFNAITKVQKAREAGGTKGPGYADVAELQGLVSKHAQRFPYPTLRALRTGWPDEPLSRATRAGVGVFMALAVLLTIVTVQLSFTYTRGAAIVLNLEALASENPHQDFSRLVADVAEAEAQLGAGPADAATLDRAREDLLDDESELNGLSDRVADAVRTAVYFMADDVQFPVVGMRQIRCGLGDLRVRDPAAFDVFAGPCRRGMAAATGGPTLLAEAAPSGVRLAAAEPESYGESAFDACGRPVAAATSDGDGLVASPADPMQAFAATMDRLLCGGVIHFTPQDFPQIASHVAHLKAVLANYALCLLPALYGAMGAVLYQMRMMLDPLLPNPAIGRLVHRVFLGALAGIVLSWFFTPDDLLTSEVAGLGFTIFGLAFLFGFSLEVFFDLLDRFVTSASRLGSSRSEGGQPSGAGNGASATRAAAVEAIATQPSSSTDGGRDRPLEPGTAAATSGA